MPKSTDLPLRKSAALERVCAPPPPDFVRFVCGDCFLPEGYHLVSRFFHMGSKIESCESTVSMNILYTV